MSRVEAFRDINPRSLLRELRTDIAMAVDDSFPLVYGLADKNIITDQLLKVSAYVLTVGDENISSFPPPVLTFLYHYLVSKKSF